MHTSANSTAGSCSTLLAALPVERPAPAANLARTRRGATSAAAAAWPSARARPRCAGVAPAANCTRACCDGGRHQVVGMLRKQGAPAAAGGARRRCAAGPRPAALGGRVSWPLAAGGDWGGCASVWRRELGPVWVQAFGGGGKLRAASAVLDSPHHPHRDDAARPSARPSSDIPCTPQPPAGIPEACPKPWPTKQGCRMAGSTASAGHSTRPPTAAGIPSCAQLCAAAGLLHRRRRRSQGWFASRAARACRLGIPQRAGQPLRRSLAPPRHRWPLLLRGPTGPQSLSFLCRSAASRLRPRRPSASLPPLPQSPFVLPPAPPPPARAQSR